MAVQLPNLPYAENALEPHYSAKTISFHYGKHHKAYVDNLNKLIAGTPLEGKSLEEIVKGINKVTDLVAEIAAASNEQAQGIAQVNIGLAQIDQVTQQNTANAEESASAAEELSSQAGHLQQILQRFVLKSESRRFDLSYDAERIPAKEEDPWLEVSGGADKPDSWKELTV